MWSSNLQERNFINEICPWIVVESVCLGLGVGKEYWVSYSASLLMPLRQIAYWIRIDLFDSPLSFNHLAPKIYFNCRVYVCVCVCVYVCVFALQSYPTLATLWTGNWQDALSMEFTWQENSGACCQSLLQGIFPTLGLNPGLLHHRQILYCLSHQGTILSYSYKRPK